MYKVPCKNSIPGIKCWAHEFESTNLLLFFSEVILLCAGSTRFQTTQKTSSMTYLKSTLSDAGIYTL